MRKFIAYLLSIATMVATLQTYVPAYEGQSLGKNVAFHRNVEVSKESAKNDYNKLDFLTDGNLETKYQSPLVKNNPDNAYEDYQTWSMDLGREYEIDKVVLYWEVAAAKEYDIYVSDDKKDWTMVAAEKAGEKGRFKYDFTPVHYTVEDKGTAWLITTGKVIDFGVKDSMNMGACMAPAACDTILQNLMDFGRGEKDYDRIITGDLGYVGQSILFDLLRKKGLDIKENHMDCGMTIFDQQTQHTNSGGSGCGCAAITLAAYIMPQLISGEWKRILFVPTGALMSTVSFNEGESVPGIAHGIVLEHC